MGRWLRLLAACTTLPPLPEATCGGASSFAWKPDTDFPFCDLDGSRETASAQECAELCRTIEGCRAASWNGPDSRYNDSHCNLKSCAAPAAGPGLMGVVLEGGVPSALPAEWCQDYMRADLLFTENEAGVEYLPDVGNGFVATVVGAQFMYVAGVYNGPAVSDKPSHRAEIPAPLRLTIDAPTVGGGLHLRNGVYLRRYAVGSGAVVEMRFYAHRTRRSVLVVDLTTTSSEPVEVRVAGFGGEEPDSEDFVWAARKSVGLQATAVVWTGETREAETATHGTTRVSVVLPMAPAGPVTVAADKPASYVAAVRTSRESEDPDGDALRDWAEAGRRGPDGLYAEHRAAWARLWASGLEVASRPDVARAVNSSLYYLLSSLRADAPYSTSPGGLAQGGTHRGYLGHVFWDAETWMYPTLVLWHPDVAASMLEYRLGTVPEAERKARGYGKGWKGAMFAWESAASGTETCPQQFSEGQLEQHITGDVALAAQQLWYASHNASWLKHAAEGLVLKTADFWASRAEWSDGAAHFRTVMPPDESADQGVSDSVYTNFVAKRNLLFAEEASQALGRTPDPAWRKTADAIVIRYDAERGIHPEYDGYENATIKQADVVLLGYPLTMNMSLEDRRRDLEFYAPRTDPQAPCMSWSMYVVGYLDVGDLDGAAASFEHSFANSHAPFNVWTETPTGGCVGFLTGLGGFLQTMLFGVGGLRIWRSYLAINPSLISGMTRVVIRGVHYRDAVLQISFDQDEMEVLAVRAPRAVQLTDSSGSTRSLAEGDLARVPRGRAKIRVSQSRRALRLNELRLLSV